MHAVFQSRSITTERAVSLAYRHCAERSHDTRSVERYQGHAIPTEVAVSLAYRQCEQQVTMHTVFKSRRVTTELAVSSGTDIDCAEEVTMHAVSIDTKGTPYPLR